MTQEEKQLLLKDLCARLPYGVMANHYVYGQIGRVRSVYWDMQGVEIQIDNKHYDVPIEELVVYLRPMSSMTKEERREYDKLIAKCIYDPDAYFFENYNRLYDWLLSHHFDYRGLIEKGLALEAPKDMYKTE